MAFVTILPLRARVPMRPGQRLLDVLDELERPLFRTACRAGNCGACRLEVIAGGAELRPPSAREHTTLMQLRAAANERLGCQLVLAGDPPDDIVLSLPSVRSR
jgi:ferredoxin